MVKLHLAFVFSLLSLSSIYAQKKRPLFVLDLPTSKYFKYVMGSKQIQPFDKGLMVGYTRKKQWAVYNYFTHKEYIDNRLGPTKEPFYDFFNTKDGHIFVYDDNYTFVNKKNHTMAFLDLNTSVTESRVLFDKYLLVALEKTNEIAIYDKSKRVFSQKVKEPLNNYLGYRYSKNRLSMVIMEYYNEFESNRLVEYQYDTLSNKLLISEYLYEGDDLAKGNYLSYSDDQYIYCLINNFSQLSIRRRKGQKEKLEEVTRIPLSDYFPNPKINPLVFEDDSPNFFIDEIDGQLCLSYIYKRKLYYYLLDITK